MNFKKGTTVYRLLQSSQNRAMQSLFKGLMQSFVVFVLTTLTCQTYGQQPEWIRVDTLYITSSPVFVNRLQGDTLVILPIGLYSELKYGTAYASNCIQENLELNREVAVEGAYREQYKWLYESVLEDFKECRSINGVYQTELAQCATDNVNANIVIEELTQGKRRWANAFFIAVGVAVIEFVVIVIAR